MPAKVERLLSLIQMLLEARRAVSLDKIRAGFPDYRDAASDAAFHKMFERDKTDIRELGFHLEAVTDDWGDEAGYRIDRDASLIADPGFTPEEVAALGLAVSGARGQGAHAAAKLGVASGVEPHAGWVVASPDPDPRVAVLADAIARRKRVRFKHRAPGREPMVREVEPHALRARAVWYLSGFDLTRGEERTFKVARIEGRIEVSPGDDPEFDEPAPPQAWPTAPWIGEAAVTAKVAATANASWWIERRARAEATGTDERGRTILSLPVADPRSFAGFIAGFGAEAEVLEPEEIRDLVVVHLQRVLDAT